MDSTRDFGLLAESVPQVRVSACALAFLGFFNYMYIYMDIKYRHYLTFTLLLGMYITYRHYLTFRLL